MPGPALALALQGGGSHGAYTWGVLDRVLQEVEAGRLEIAAISGTSAGALNAAVTAAGLVEGGPSPGADPADRVLARPGRCGRAARQLAVRLRRAGPIRLQHRLEPRRDRARGRRLGDLAIQQPILRRCARPADRTGSAAGPPGSPEHRLWTTPLPLRSGHHQQCADVVLAAERDRGHAARLILPAERVPRRDDRRHAVLGWRLYRQPGADAAARRCR